MLPLLEGNSSRSYTSLTPVNPTVGKNMIPYHVVRVYIYYYNQVIPAKMFIYNVSVNRLQDNIQSGSLERIGKEMKMIWHIKTKTEQSRSHLLERSWLMCFAKGILLIDYLEKGRTITGEYYSNLLERCQNSREDTWLEEEKKNIFHQDNAPAHISVLAMGKLWDLRYDLLGHPDLAPSNFNLFPNLKKFVPGKPFVSNEELERAIDKYFKSSRLSLPGRNTDIGETLDQVCWSQGRLCRKIKSFLNLKSRSFIVRSRTSHLVLVC